MIQYETDGYPPTDGDAQDVGSRDANSTEKVHCVICHRRYRIGDVGLVSPSYSSVVESDYLVPLREPVNHPLDLGDIQ